MLFDLRGRGRQRTVKVIYLGLAVLMGGGLVFFGVGGNVSGGLFDAIGITGNGGQTSSGGDQLKKLEQRYAKRVTVNPKDERAWAGLADSRYKLAGQGKNYDQNAGVFTDEGKAQLQQAATAWERYLALKPEKPDSNVATLMVQAYGPAGLNEPAKGVDASEIVAQARPSSATYFQFAVYAYAAGQTRKAELAGKKALSLAPKDQREAVQAQLDAAKKQGGFGQPGGAGAATSGS
jgi:tetratricopeptide (TPR) repeat protein